MLGGSNPDATVVQNGSTNDSSVVSQDKSLPPTPGQPQADGKSKQDEKKEMMERLQPPKGAKATDAGKQKGDRWLRDPVTGQDVLVKDPQFKGMSPDNMR
jgi:hypothetical protein